MNELYTSAGFTIYYIDTYVIYWLMQQNIFMVLIMAKLCFISMISSFTLLFSMRELSTLFYLQENTHYFDYLYYVRLSSYSKYIDLYVQSLSCIFRPKLFGGKNMLGGEIPRISSILRHSVYESNDSCGRNIELELC